MKELQEQLTTVQHEVKQRQLRCQELEEQLKGSHELNAKLQQEADEYCSSVDKLEEELTITRQKHQIAIQEVIVCACVCIFMHLMPWNNNQCHAILADLKQFTKITKINQQDYVIN